MIGKALQAIQLGLLVLVLGLGAFVTYKGYQVYVAVQARMSQIDEWIKRFVDREKHWHRCETKINAIEEKFAEAAASRSDTPAKPDTPSRPTVILYSIPGCDPCERWWRDDAPKWIANGWDVTRKTSNTADPTPYFDVWDGAKWMRVDGRLDADTYRKAGGK